MARKRRKFARPRGERRYKKLFIVASEGTKTEPQYFAALDCQRAVVKVECLKGKHQSAPPRVLQRMKRRLGKENLRSSDEAWLVVDKDQWTDEQLEQLHGWSKCADNYGFALSNPNFEYWVLLHFEDGIGISTSRDCIDRLTLHLPDYDKGISHRKITRAMIDDAIRRAKARDNPPCVDWPRNASGTTVYKLVEKILQA